MPRLVAIQMIRRTFLPEIRTSLSNVIFGDIAPYPQPKVNVNDSQLGCRGTQGLREEVSRVPPNV